MEKNNRKIPEAKPEFTKRMKEILGKDFQKYLNILKKPPIRSIRCNTLKITPNELKKSLEIKGWKISQPWPKYPEVMTIDNELQPGELGRSLEHLLGYYYIQELASMLPVIALNPKPNELILDLCSAPGSKTTQLAAQMQNTGTIIANEVSLGRIKILASNLERCGVTNTIITKKEGSALCNKFKKLHEGGKIDKGEQEFPLFDRILVDAPCSGEGTLRSSPKTYLMWNIKTVKALPRIQTQLLESALKILKPNGVMIYSTCTHAPEENEGVIDYALKKLKNQIKMEKIYLPIKPRQGITKWQDKEYSWDVQLSCRIYPQDNNTEGFFLAKIKKQ